MKEEEMKCFYHTDVDGKCSGAIVKKFYDEHDDRERETIEEIINQNIDIRFNCKGKLNINNFTYDVKNYDILNLYKQLRERERKLLKYILTTIVESPGYIKAKDFLKLVEEGKDIEID
jgi:hypothetical protein